jgi:hypothetical protein
MASGEREAARRIDSGGPRGGRRRRRINADALSAGIKDAIAGKKVDPDKLGLPASEVRVFRLTQELVNFIHMLERGRIAFLNEVESGPSGGMGTQILKGAQDQVRKQILAVLNDEEGSSEG